MAEIQRAFVEVEFNYVCDAGDGGVLFYDGGVEKDEFQADVFPHRCSIKSDKTVYMLKTKYPRVEYQLINLTLPGLI